VYFVTVEKKASFSRRNIMEMLPTVLSEENGKFNFNFVHLPQVMIGLH